MSVQFIEWSSSDEEGTFSHIGQLIPNDSDDISFVTEYGIVMNVPQNDGEIRMINQPENWEIKQVEPMERKPVEHKPKVKRTRVRSDGGMSRQDQVIQLMTNEPDLLLSRKIGIARIIEVVGMTPAGASTYYSNVKKILRERL